MGKFYEGVYQDLSLYVRQAAWLGAVPETKESESIARGETVRGMSHKERIEANGGKPLMPPVYAASYLLDYLWEVGPAGNGYAGPVPITQQEIQAWQSNMDRQLQPWEVNMISWLSKDYVNQSYLSKDPECPAPFGSPLDKFDRDVISRKVGNAFKAYAVKK